MMQLHRSSSAKRQASCEDTTSPESISRFRIRLDTVESAAARLAQSASCAEDAVREAMQFADFCRAVERTSIAISLAAKDSVPMPEAYGATAEDLYLRSARAMSAVRRMGGHAATLIAHIQAVSCLFSEMSSGLELPEAFNETDPERLLEPAKAVSET